MSRLLLSGDHVTFVTAAATDLSVPAPSMTIGACGCGPCSAAKSDLAPISAAAPTVVSDYTALLSGYAIHDASGQGAFYSFSFPDVLPDYYGDIYSTVGLQTFRPFTDAEKAVARAAIQSYADISGLTFFEVSPNEGDIKFSVFDLDVLTPGDGEAAFAYFPIGAVNSRIASDVFVDFREVDRYVLLHEIGHAVGLKHPFDDTPILNVTLDDVGHTVMSYTFRDGADGTQLGPFDIQAIRFLYGDETFDGTQVASWSWNPATLTLTQIGAATGDPMQGIGGSDIINALGGNDTVYAGEGNDTILGGDGDDDLYGGVGNDLVDGGAGDDYFVWEGGNDTLLGGDGDDEIVFFESVDGTVLTIDGGAGRDTLSFVQLKGPAAFSLTTLVDSGWQLSNLEAVTLFGSNLVDTITGAGTPDQIQGGGGADILTGLAGNDTLFGGAANDTLFGGAGNDALYGENGDDLIDGGSGADTIDGGIGFDTVSYASETAGVTVTLNGTRQVASVTEFLISIEGAIGSAFNDRITGTIEANRIEGAAGMDTLIGGGGADTLLGGIDDDMLEGGGGEDSIDGGSGYDVAVFADTSAQCAVSFDGDVCVVTTATQGMDRLSGVEALAFGDILRTVASFGVTPPVVTQIAPGANATGIARDTLIHITFNEAVVAGSGTLRLERADGALVESFTIGTSRAILSSNELVLDPTHVLLPGTEYRVEVGAGAVADLAGTPLAGGVEQSFTTVPAVAGLGYRLITSPGFSGAVGGKGVIFGTSTGYQDINVADDAGTLTFDASFNRGGDVIRLAGPASSYVASVSGSSTNISDGDTTIIVPAGPTGVDVYFQDGVRPLRIVSGSIALGDQVLTVTATAVTALPGTPRFADGSLADAAAQLSVTDESLTMVGGNVNVVGTNGPQIIVVAEEGGVIRFDASFNKGGDHIIFGASGVEYTARLSGSSVLLERSDGDFIIPVGPTPSAIDFADGERSLAIVSGSVMLGDQVITGAATALMALG